MIWIKGDWLDVPNLIGTAVATDGSVSNVAGIAGGGMQSGFVQWDVAHWAFNGSGIYEGKPKVDVLRAIANLYPESFHVVARKDFWHQDDQGPQGQARLAR